MLPSDPLGLTIFGIALGAAAGVSPGPHFTVVVQETLKHGPRNGIQVAIAPLITDAPIVIVTLALLHFVADSQVLTGIVAIAGATYLTVLGVESLRVTTPESIALDPGRVKDNGSTTDPHVPPSSVARGALVNLLNPNAWIFWATIGAPVVILGYEVDPLGPVLFLTVFYILLVGLKTALAVLVGRTRHLLRSNGYLWTNRALGGLLLGFATVFASDGLHRLQLL